MIESGYLEVLRTVCQSYTPLPPRKRKPEKARRTHRPREGRVLTAFQTSHNIHYTSASLVPSTFEGFRCCLVPCKPCAACLSLPSDRSQAAPCMARSLFTHRLLKICKAFSPRKNKFPNMDSRVWQAPKIKPQNTSRFSHALSPTLASFPAFTSAIFPP